MICTISPCDNQAHSRGMCRKHYMRWWTHGDARKAKWIPPKAGAPREFMMALPSIGRGCIIWPFARNNQGYAQINLGENGKFLVSRIVCRKRHGNPPSLKSQAAHSCGKGHMGCIAPWHLSWKSAAENTADRYIHGTILFGESCAQAKLTEKNVHTIRALDGIKSHSKIALEFGVSQTLISRIIRRKRWKHI